MRDELLAEFDDIIEAHAEHLVSERDMDRAEARQSSRRGLSKNRGYFDEDPDSFFDDISDL